MSFVCFPPEMPESQLVSSDSQLLESIGSEQKVEKTAVSECFSEVCQEADKIDEDKSRIEEKGEKKIITLSVANLMYDPTPLNNYNSQISIGVKKTSIIKRVNSPIPKINVSKRLSLPVLPNHPIAMAPLIHTPMAAYPYSNHSFQNPNMYYVPIQNRFPIHSEFQPKMNEPVFYNEEGSGMYGVSCICENNHNKGLLIQCERCQYWLHSICVNIARASSNEVFICPRCQGNRLRCKCKKNNDYSQPIIQCTKCHFWCHKKCEGLGYGRIPNMFVCSNCRTSLFMVPNVRVLFNPRFESLSININSNTISIIESLPEGLFRKELEIDLNSPRLFFSDIITKFFNMFGSHLISQNKEFFKLFTKTFTDIFRCSQDSVIEYIDLLTQELVYSKDEIAYPDPVTGFSYSESITHFVENEKLPLLENNEPEIELYEFDNNIRTKNLAVNGQLLVILDGFLLHSDEVNADRGIPKTCFSVFETDLIIDIAGTALSRLSRIGRSYNPNSIVKLFSQNGSPRVGIFCLSSNGIQKDEILKLPFDGGIPYPHEKVQWKDKKQKPKPPVSKKKVTHKKNFQEISLLSSFNSDLIPPLPFVLVSNDESQKKPRDKIRK